MKCARIYTLNPATDNIKYSAMPLKALGKKVTCEVDSALRKLPAGENKGSFSTGP